MPFDSSASPASFFRTNGACLVDNDIGNRVGGTGIVACDLAPADHSSFWDYSLGVFRLLAGRKPHASWAATRGRAHETGGERARGPFCLLPSVRRLSARALCPAPFLGRLALKSVPTRRPCSQTRQIEQNLAYCAPCTGCRSRVFLLLFRTILYIKWLVSSFLTFFALYVWFRHLRPLCSEQL